MITKITRPARVSRRVLATGSLLVAGCILLAGCALESPRGSGPITVSKRVQQGFEKYKAEQAPGYFAVSEDGRTYGYSFCQDLKCRAGGQHVALRSCGNRTTTSTCRIFAREREITWEGPVTYE